MKLAARISLSLLFGFISFLIKAQEISHKLTSWDTSKYHYSFEENKNRLNEIFEVIKKQSDSAHYANYYRRLGTLYKDNGKYKDAIDCYITEAGINKNTGNVVASASNINQIGVIYYRLNNFEKSLSFFLQAYSIYESENSLRGIASAGVNISETYAELDSFPQAIYYANKGLEAIRGMKDTTEIGYNYYSLGLIYLKQNLFDSALKYFRKSEYNYPSSHDYKNLIPTYNSIAQLFLNQNLFDSAITYHTMALDTATKYQNQPLIAETYSYLSKAYEKKGDLLNAYHYLKQLKNLDGKLLDSATVKYITDAEIRYRSVEKDSKITEQANQIKIKNLWLVIVIIISIAVFIISALLILSYRTKRHIAQNKIQLQKQQIDSLLQQQEVDAVNAMLKGQDNERKRIAQELHDRLGSILSTIKLHFSSVEEQMQALKEQQNKSYGEASQLLDEAVDEVRRISHDLYEGSLARFGFKTALLQLIDAIEKANAVKIIFIDNNIDGTFYKAFEQDLYRITQELLSNSLKYSNAKEITIQLTYLNGCFKYMYEDNGKGFDTKRLESSMGIGYKNIAARVAKINGSWHLDSSPGHGMTLLIEIADENH
jgi:two-component system, NarL family, sensor kinase